MVTLLVWLWLTGGASRADVSATVLVRAGAWGIVIAAIWLVPIPRWRDIKPLAYIVLASIVLLSLQLVPLPPEIWTRLPGRALLMQAATVSGQPQPWRPLSISPDATVNALMSMVVPVAALWLMGAMDGPGRRSIAAVVLALVVVSVLVAAVQFSGTGFDNPLLNEPPGAVSGLFANRNHFALFLAAGCGLVPYVAFQMMTEPRWVRWAGLPVTGLLLLTALASGSRVGAVLCVLGCMLGLAVVHRDVIRELRRAPRRRAATILLLAVVALTGFVGLSFLAGRAISFERAVSLSEVEDPRAVFLPIVIHEVGRYWPFGAGFGTFDPVFRITEPETMLSARYLNHAHNDPLEIILDGGFLGVVLVLWALGLFVWNSLAVWRPDTGLDSPLARAGSVVLLLIFIASLFEYPGRTPLIMALTVIAAVWLTDRGVAGSAEMRRGKLSRRLVGPSSPNGDSLA